MGTGEMTMRYALVVGTRPEIIKMAPIAWQMENLGLEYAIFFTGQHFDANMSLNFFDEMGYKKSRIRDLSPSGIVRGEWNAGQAFHVLDSALDNQLTCTVLAEGDTTSVMLAATIAGYKGFKFGHVEAGLRSRDHRMREERFRCAADHIADYLFCPMKYHKDNVYYCGGKKFVVGNTIADVVERFGPKDGVACTGQVLITLHRNELLTNKPLFRNVVQSLANGLVRHNLHGIFPVHPHTAKILWSLFPGAAGVLGIKFVSPVSYAENLKLISSSELVITDSGGIQEEACILKTPCLIVRENTEREETLGLGAAVRKSPVEIANTGVDLRGLLHGHLAWGQPYGKKVGKEIVKILLEEEYHG
jgi:UDP-N-acetylglucosamine 2-epimerase (non-hydrolysing)